ncbi:MAG: M6 family metalloprotease domain-containing protein [Bacteroidales bacterium]|nr:M6 family metalloprotease domain-containing protein [Bacteroidales bacterium]
MKTISISSFHLIITSVLVCFFVTTRVNAAYLENIPVSVIQPNGDTLHIYASGDEFYNYLHDENGYTIIQNNQGYYMYATYEGDKIVPSHFIAGAVNPSHVGLKPYVRISAREYQERRAQWFNHEDIPRSKSPTRNQGKMNNLVVFIRFADEEEITKPFTTIESIYNNQTTTTSNSMINYFETTSYGKLSILSHFFPEPDENQIISYQDIYPRAYYKPYNETTNPEGYDPDDRDERIEREHLLLVRAIEFIASSVPADLNIDYDNDGNVDNVCFVIKGATTAWADLLWPHRWSLFSEEVYINEKRVYDYNFMLLDATGYFTNAVLSHEMQHTLGFPDLYHYNFGKDLVPCGNWDIMESNPNPPQQSGAYMKWKYGNWLDEPALIQPGTYSLNSIGSGIEPVSYKIPSSDPKQFFVLEFRNRKDDFDKVPGTGLLIYRINTNWIGNAGYNPGKGVFDEVYIYRFNSNTPYEQGLISRAHFGILDRFEFNVSSNPRPFLTDGTYVLDLDISDITISELEDQVTFTVNSIPLGINENKYEKGNFSIYPNPANNYVEICFSNSKLFSSRGYAHIYDVQGLLLKTVAINNEITSIDISSLAKGFYIIKIGNEVKKLIIK